MHISQRGLTLIENFEGFRSTQYNDGTGVMTIGYGTTSADVSPLPTFLSRADAEALLARKIAEKYEPSVNNLGVPLNQNQFDALVSLAYNVGPGVMGWQIGQDLRARRYGNAAQDFLRYVYAGGQILQGLVNRRQAERQLFLTPWVDPDPQHYARFDRTDRDLPGGRRANEEETAREYDSKRAHWRRYPFRLRRLRDNASFLAARLEEVMRDDPAHAQEFDRPWRKGQLEGRALGRRYA